MSVSTLFGISLWPPFSYGSSSPTLPYDLAETIEDRFNANTTTLSTITELYESQAGNQSVNPYATYKISRGTPLLLTDTVRVYDRRVSFQVYADTEAQANRLRDALDLVFNTGDFTYQTGFSIPFFEVDRAEGEEPGHRLLGPHHKDKLTSSSQ
jgi:hypothetical protein